MKSGTEDDSRVVTAASQGFRGMNLSLVLNSSKVPSTPLQL